MVYRKKLEDLINENGGEYRGNLTKDITHLVAKEPSGAKFNYAGQWGIKIVAVEWTEHSLKRGMILDESLYNLHIPAEARGQGAWRQRSISPTSLSKRVRGEDPGPQNSRKLRRTASARLSSSNAGLWTDIIGGEIKSESFKASEWDDEQEECMKKDITTRTLKYESTNSRNLQQGDNASLDNVDDNIRSVSERSHRIQGLFGGRTFLLQGFDQKKV